MGSCVSRQDVVHQQTGRVITDVQKSIELDTPLQKVSSGARIDKNSPDIRDQINAEIRALREQLVHSQVLFTYLLKNSSSESTKSPDGKKELCTLLEGGALGEAMFQCKSFDGQALARLYNRSNRSSSSYTSTPMHCGYTSLSCPILPIDPFPVLTKSTQTDQDIDQEPFFRQRTNSFLSAVGSREEFPRKLSILLEEEESVSCLSQPFLNRKKSNAKTQTDAPINSNKNLPVTETCYPRCGFSIVSQAVQKRTVFSVELPMKLVLRYPPPYTTSKRPHKTTRHLSLEKQESFSSSCDMHSVSSDCLPPTYQQSILSQRQKNSQIDAPEQNTERAVTPPKGIFERAKSDGDAKLMDCEKKGFKQRSLRRGSGAGSPNSLLTIPRCPAFDFSEQEDVFPESSIKTALGKSEDAVDTLRLKDKKRDTKSLMPELMENSETESTKGSFECESLESSEAAAPPDIAFPSLPNTFLAKLGVHKDSPLPVEAFDEQDLESKFVALSLAFKTDRSTLNKRLELHKRQRDMAEKNVENEFQSMRDQLSALNLKATNSDIRDLISKIQNHLDIAQQATSRVSGRSETYGAVQQEERVSQAFEVLVLHVDHLKRLFDKEHKELEETKRMLTDTRVFKKDFTTAAADIITEDQKKYSKTFGLPVSSIKSVGRRRASVADPFLDPEFSQKVQEACSSGAVAPPRTSPVEPPFQSFSSKKDVWTRKLSSVTDEHLEESGMRISEVNMEHFMLRAFDEKFDNQFDDYEDMPECSRQQWFKITFNIVLQFILSSTVGKYLKNPKIQEVWYQNSSFTLIRYFCSGILVFVALCCFCSLILPCIGINLNVTQDMFATVFSTIIFH